MKSVDADRTQPQVKPPPIDAATLGGLAVDTADYVRAWSVLLASEVRLAGVSAVRLGIALLVVPVLVLCIGVAIDALIAALLQRWLHEWASVAACVLGIDLVCLGALLLAMRAWWRNLKLPRSRDALTRLLERLA